MAVLKDTLVQGSARVTDTLYTTNIAGGKIIQPITWTADGLPEKGSSAEFFLAIDSFQNGGKTYWVSKANTLSAIGAATSGHNHNTTYLRLDGSNIMTGTLAIKPASGEGGELHLCASTANATEAGIVLDHLSNSLRIFGIASADGTTKTGVGTPLVIDPYAKTITGGYTITGALTGHASSDLALTGGKMTGRIYREGVASNWHKGRDNSLVAISTKNGYSPLASMKTTNGSWEIGTYDNSSFTDDLLFTYITDTLYNGSTATTSAQLRFYETGGALFTGQTTVEYNPNGVNATAKGMINLTSSAPATVVVSGTYSWGINHLVPNLASGAHTCLITGMGDSTNNSAVLEFNYVGSNHADNSVGLGLYGNNQLLTINKAGTVKIKATTASTSSTTGALVVGGGIGTGAASYLTGSVHITGTAGSNALIVRGISGCYEDGNRGDPATQPENTALYLNLNNGPIYLGSGSTTASDVIYMQYAQDASSSATGAVRIGGGLGVAKKIYAGSTISAPNFIATHTAGGSSEFKVQYSSTISYWWGVGTANENHGLYDDKANKWIILAGAANTWSFDGNATTATTASKLTNFKVTTNTNLGVDAPSTNAIGYVSGLTKANWNYQQTDGSLYTQFYNASWISEIFQDYRTGQLSVRGKNNGTWQSWRRILDETNGATILGLSNYRANTQPKSGAWFTGTPVVGTDGVTEVGKYIDFHSTNDGTSDYDARITASTSGLTLSGTTTGTFSGNLTGNASGTASNVTGTVTTTHGGTGITTYTVGDILYCSAANTLSKLAKGTAGQFLKMGTANVPIWGEGSEVTLNGTPTTTPSFYAPTQGGTANHILKSGGVGAEPVWDPNVTVNANGGLSATTIFTDNIYQKTSWANGAPTTNQQKVMFELDDSTGSNLITYFYNRYYPDSTTSRTGLQVSAPIANTETTTYFELSINADGTTKRTYTDAQIYGAVWNDYAEYRKQAYKITPGHVVIDLDNGLVIQTEQRLMPGAQVVSDTFGFAIGENDECKTPLAVSGRVLVYPYRNRYEYHAGMAVCSAPNGTVDIMTREEIKEYPDAIVGIVSEIPQYEEWGEKPVKVDGRIWIKVK